MHRFPTIKLAAAAALMIGAMYTTAHAKTPNIDLKVEGNDMEVNVFVNDKGAKDRFAPKGYMRDRNKNCFYRVYSPLSDEYGHWNGECDEAGYITGYGRLTFTYPSGAPGDHVRFTEAHFEAGSASGQGRQVYMSGDVYSGMFNLGDMEGYGMYEFDDGNFYEGEFRNSRPAEEGVISNNHGDIFEVVVTGYPAPTARTMGWDDRNRNCYISLGSKSTFREALRWCMTRSLKQRKDVDSSGVTITLN